MRAMLILFLGIGLMIFGAIVYYALGTVDFVTTEGADYMNQFRPLASGALFVIGGLMTLSGLISVAKKRKKRRLTLEIMETGVATTAKVTFVDRNYVNLVNDVPVYAIVEYVYQDGVGNQYTKRVDDVKAEAVIRNQIQEGSTIDIKYASTDPSKSILSMGEI